MGGNLIKENGCLEEGVSKNEFNNLSSRVSASETNITALESGKINDYKTIRVTNFNNVTETGFYYCSIDGAKNAPTTGNGYLFVHRYTNDWIYQRYTSVSLGTIFFRVCSNGSWKNWERIYTSVESMSTNSIVPIIDSTYSIGSSSNRYVNGCFENIYAYTSIGSGNVYPFKNDTYNIGTSTSRYKQGYFNHLNVYGDTGKESKLTNLYTDNPKTVLYTNPNGFRLLVNGTSTYAPIEASAFNQQSSRRYKENIVDMSEEEANKIDDINVVKFDYKIKENGTDMAGFIAEDLYKILPNVVTTANIDGEEVPDSVDYTKIVPYLLKNIQMLKKRVSELEEK